MVSSLSAVLSREVSVWDIQLMYMIVKLRAYVKLFAIYTSWWQYRDPRKEVNHGICNYIPSRRCYRTNVNNENSYTISWKHRELLNRTPVNGRRVFVIPFNLLFPRTLSTSWRTRPASHEPTGKDCLRETGQFLFIQYLNDFKTIYPNSPLICSNYQVIFMQIKQRK
jgi:hypothetical protein